MSDTKRVGKAFTTFGLSEIDKAGVLRTGASAAKRASIAQGKLVEQQQKSEKRRVQEAESEIQKRRLFARSSRSGRQSLISAGASQGGANTLGGTQNA